MIKLTNRLFSIAVLIIVISVTAASLPLARASAAASANLTNNCVKNSSTILGFPTWYKYLKPTVVSTGNSYACHLEFDFEKPGDISKIILAITEIVLRIGGLAAVGFIIYGGFNYVTSQGDPQKAASARKYIINAIIGIVISGVATYVVQIIAQRLVA